MSNGFLSIVVFGGFSVAIWFSYRLFMRGDTNAERVAKHLPADFKPEWSWRYGDTYVGYESASDRLAIVDYPHGTVVKPSDVESIEAYDDGELGIVHRWIGITVSQQSKRYRLWCGMSTSRREAVLTHLKGILAAR
jgi:hypothetical protein